MSEESQPVEEGKVLKKEMGIILTTNFANELLKYLATRPIQEAGQLYNSLSQAKPTEIEFKSK